MKYYFAPLEGITGFAYRNVHHALFPGMDGYFSPFLSAKQTHKFENKEKRDVDPQNNAEITLTPQIMANKVDDFVWAAHELHALGYPVVNLNLGCPMPTIVTKHKGSGMLADLDALAQFLDGIFDGTANDGPKISIKTRLGKDDLSQACQLMELYNRYPLHELIIHARCQKDLYKGHANLDVFEACLNVTQHRICYNGDIFTKSSHDAFVARFGQNDHLAAIMLGRGIIADPALHREILGGKPITKTELRRYHDALYANYEAQNGGLSPLLHRMKELWFYIGTLFIDAEKAVHKIRIAQTVEQYRPAVDRIFQTCEIGGHFEGM